MTPGTSRAWLVWPWIKKKPRRAGVCANRCHPQADSCFAWLWYPSGELLICWQNSINKGLLIIIMLSIWVLVGGNTKEMWLCSWYQGAWRLKGLKTKSSPNTLPDIFHPELEENHYKFESDHILGIHLRNQEHGAKIIQWQSLPVEWAMEWMM